MDVAGEGKAGGAQEWTQEAWAIPVDDPSFTIDPEDPESQLGAGAFGFVIRARLGEENVAAKTSYMFQNPRRHGLVGPMRDPAVVEGLQFQISECMRESAALRRLEHPMLIRFKGIAYSLLEGNAVPTYMLMELVEGGTLHLKMYGLHVLGYTSVLFSGW
jgi:hypothetical protein